MFPIAQTNIQLFNQLRRIGMAEEGMGLVRRAYSLAMKLYSGYYQADGKPFVCHCVGVASIVAHLGLPAEIVAAGCIHNIYGNGDFGDGLNQCVTPERQRSVQDAVGGKVEELIFRFKDLRFDSQRMKEMYEEPGKLNPVDRQLVVMDFADLLEKYVDLGVLYYGDNHWVTNVVEDHGKLVIKTAERLGYLELTTALKEAFLTASLESVPDSLKSGKDWRVLRLVVPLSCAPKNSPV